MIYSYKYLPHKIEKFDENFTYFFTQLVKNDLSRYDENILLKPDFLAIIKSSKKLIDYLEKITLQYHNLKATDKDVIKNALENNVKLKELCGNITGANPVKYTAIKNLTFRRLLKEFLTLLWEDYYFVNSIKNNFGEIQEHFTDFKKYQNAFLCPFCGIYPLKPASGIYRNAYDHYIPKAFYPFISVNFWNLFPICHECNSDEKKAIDTLYRGNARRKVIFPFDTSYNGDDLQIKIVTKENLNTKQLKTLLNEINWELEFKISGLDDPRLTSWDEIFHIKRRYKENLCDYENLWFNDFVIKRYKEELIDGMTFTRFKEKLIIETKSQIKNNGLSIVRLIYFDFLFSIPDVENKLNAIII
ncbi:MAG: hypothetical protein QM710_06020 [Flavobacterium sp.]